MRDIDKKIQEALRAEDVELFGEFGGEQSMLEMVVDSFRGRMRWFMAFAIVVTVAMLVAMVAAAIAFYRAEEIREMILYAMVFGIFGGGISMMKIWYWMELNKNTLTREIKRLELQVARLSSRIGK